MKIYNKSYSCLHITYAVLMTLLLSWLTISAPFVSAFQEELAAGVSKNTEAPIIPAGDEDSSPIGSNTEEKVPNTSSFSEEYIHEQTISNHSLTLESMQYNKCDNAGIYIAFHGEQLVPPPNAA